MKSAANIEQIKIKANVDHLGDLREFVTRIGKKNGYSERVINAFKLSIDEAATNIIKHAYKEWDGDITIKAIKRKSSLTFVLIDNGKYFDPRQFKDPDLQKYVDIGKKGGLGIFMMRRLLDRIDYKKTEEGNELWLTKNKQEKGKRHKITVSPIPLGLKARYWLVSMAAFTIVLILVYLFFFLNQNEIVLTRYIDKAREACSVVGSDISENLIPDNDLITNDVIDELVKNGSMDPIILDYTNTSIKNLMNTEYSNMLLNAIVVDNIQNILATAEYDTVHFKRLSQFNIPENHKSITTHVYLYQLQSGLKVMDVTWPVTDERGRNLCTLHFLIDHKKIQHDINSARFNYFNLVLLVWIIGSAGLFLLIYLVMTPLKRLQDWVKTMNQPGDLEDFEIDTSTEVGEIAKAFSDITLKLRNSQVNLAEQERMQKEMQVAQEIQQTLLPSEFPDLEGYDLASFYAAAKEVGGDYYDFVEVDQDTLGIVVADVSGKGVPGSLVMTMIRTALRTEARGVKDAAEVLTRVNDFVVNDMKKGMFVTLFYVIVDSKKRRINYASAGHNPMILYRASQKKTYYLNPRGFPIGISLPDKDLFKKSLESDSIALAEDDILIVYTDGVTEAMNTKRDLYGEERFLKVIQNNGDSSAEEFVENLKSEILSFTEGSPQNDDITLVAIKEQTSAEKLELKRAKDAYLAIQNGKSVKQACKEAGISTYSYYNKYKEKFENNNLDDIFADSPSDDYEVKQLSIEEKTKIYDVIKRFPEFGAKRISEELNSEHYENTIISPAKIYDELVNSRLNTKKLREGFIARGNRKKRMKPPGTPMMTIEGKIIVKKHEPIQAIEPFPVDEKETKIVKTEDIFSSEPAGEIREHTPTLDLDSETIVSLEPETSVASQEDTKRDEAISSEDVYSFEELTDFGFDAQDTFDDFQSEFVAPLDEVETSTEPILSEPEPETDFLSINKDNDIRESEKETDIVQLQEEKEIMDDHDHVLETLTDDQKLVQADETVVVDDLVEEQADLEESETVQEIPATEEIKQESRFISSEIDIISPDLPPEKVHEEKNTESVESVINEETVSDIFMDHSGETVSVFDDLMLNDMPKDLEQETIESDNKVEELINKTEIEEQEPEDFVHHEEQEKKDNVTEPSRQNETDSEMIDIFADAVESDNETIFDAQPEEEDIQSLSDIFDISESESPEIEINRMQNVTEENEELFDVMDVFDPDTDENMLEPAVTQPFEQPEETEIQAFSGDIDESVFESDSVDDKVLAEKSDYLYSDEQELSPADIVLNEEEDHTSLIDPENPLFEIKTNEQSEEETDVTDLGVETSQQPRDVEQEERDLIDMLDSGETFIKDPSQKEKRDFFQDDIEEANVISESDHVQGPSPVQPFDAFVENESSEPEKQEHIDWEVVKDDFDFSISYDDIWEIKEMKPESQVNTFDSKDQDKLSFEDLIELADKKRITQSNDGLQLPKEQSQKPNVQHEKDQLFRDKLMTKAVKLYEKEEYNESIQVFLELKQKQPQDYKVHGYLGNAYFHNKQYTQAAEAYEKVLEINTNNIQARENLGVVYANQGNLSKAIQQWEVLLTITPERADIKKSIDRAKKYLNKMV